MNIAGLVKSSTVDFPGNLAAVIFTPGCNLDCFYCHNRTLLTGASPRLGEAEVLAFLSKRSGLLDACVLSGGEPTLQPDLVEFIARVRAMGYRIKLDTNGTRPDVIRLLLEQKLIDYAAVDCKAPWSRYPEFCDCTPDDVARIRETFRLLDAADIGWEARTTVIPQLSPADLAAMAADLPVAPRFILQRYIKPALHRAEDRFRLEAPGYTPAQLVLFAEQLRHLQPHIQVR
jgi:pyruvate formate lyase activating enzyme